LKVLDEKALRARLGYEFNRVREPGGFVSVTALGALLPNGERDGDPRLLGWAARVIEAHIRRQDFCGWTPRELLVVMPGSSQAQAVTSAQRLLEGLTDAWGQDAPYAAGVATTYGDLEGGIDALVDAAADALRAGKPNVAQPSDVVAGRPRILVVDDDGAFAEALADTISELGWIADPCTDARDALQRVRTPDYHGLFVDLVLAGMSGSEILKESLRAFPRRPGILMSGYDSQHQAVLDVLALGPVMFVRKPISTADLETALRMFRLLLPGMATTR
jgi:CheY-like chemotaxis protein